MVSKTKEANFERATFEVNSSERKQITMDRSLSLTDWVTNLFYKLGYRNENSVLGLDIGKWSIKLVELSYTKTGWELLDADMERIVDSPFESLKKMLQKRKSKTDLVVSALPPDLVIEQLIKLPYVEKNELREMLSWEVRKLIDFPLQEAVWDYLLMNESQAEQLQIFLTIAPKQSVKEQLEFIQSCSLKGLAFETKSLALYNILRLAGRSFYEKSSMLVDLGFETSQLMIVRNGILSLSRRIGFGGKQIAETLTNLLGCSAEEAQSLIMGTDVYKDKEKSNIVSISQTIQNQLDNLIMEIQRSLAFFLTENPEGTIDKMILTGGTAKLSSLDGYLQEKLNLQTELFDPCRFVQVNRYRGDRQNLKMLWPHLAVALGLGSWRENE